MESFGEFNEFKCTQAISYIKYIIQTYILNLLTQSALNVDLCGVSEERQHNTERHSYKWQLKKQQGRPEVNPW